MGRMYTVTFDAISVSAVQDFFEINPAADKPVLIHSVQITNLAAETSEQLRMRISRISASFASGSGGASVTPTKKDPGDGSVGATCERNNTTQATGTKDVLWSEGQNVLNGWMYLPPPQSRPIFTTGEPCIIDLPTAPGAALSMSGNVEFEEIGG